MNRPRTTNDASAKRNIVLCAPKSHLIFVMIYASSPREKNAPNCSCNWFYSKVPAAKLSMKGVNFVLVNWVSQFCATGCELPLVWGFFFNFVVAWESCCNLGNVCFSSSANKRFRRKAETNELGANPFSRCEKNLLFGLWIWLRRFQEVLRIPMVGNSHKQLGYCCLVLIWQYDILITFNLFQSSLNATVLSLYLKIYQHHANNKSHRNDVIIKKFSPKIIR